MHWFDSEAVAGNRDLVSKIRKLKVFAFDFDGVFTDNMVIVDESGTEHIRSSRYDGIGLSLLRSANVYPVIISTEVNPVVQARAKKLKIQCINACDDKVAALSAVLDEQSASFGEAGFLGNDSNDLPVLGRVALPMITADAHPSVGHIAAYKARRIGGHGVVREVCDLIHHVRTGQRR